MKKMNGLKSSGRSFIKRMASCLIAGTMAFSVLPAGVEVAAEQPDGSFWETISTINMDGFTTPHKSGEVTSVWSGWKTLHDAVGGEAKDREIYLNAFSYNYYASVNNKYGWAMGQWTNVVGFADIAEANQPMLENTPAVMGDKIFCLDRRNNKYWNYGAPDTSIMVSNIFDETRVQAGDKLRISAWVYAKAPMSISSPGSAGTGTESRISMWVSERDDVNSFNTEGSVVTFSNYSAHMPSVSKPEETYFGTIKHEQWNKVVLEYTVTEENKSIASVQLNNDNIEHSVTEYPTYFYLAGLTVEKKIEAGGTFKIDDGKAYNRISTFNIDDFTDVSGTVINRWKGYQTVQDLTEDGEKKDRDVYLNAYTYYTRYTDIYNAFGLNHNTGRVSYNDTTSVNKPKIAGDTFFQLDRRWSGQDYNKMGTPSSSIAMSNIFDEKQVQVGDRLRVTAWVYPSSVRLVAEETTPEDTDTSVSMWVSERQSDSEAKPDGDYTTTDYSASEPDAAKPEESYFGTVKCDQWNKIVLEYTVTEENKSIASVQINSDNATHNVVSYPYYLGLAGLTVEKVEEKGEGSFGTAYGTVFVGLGDTEEAGETKVIVAAYDGDMFLGCDMIDYTGAGSFAFNIKNAATANSVTAFLWNMDKMNPKIAPILLTNANAVQ